MDRTRIEKRRPLRLEQEEYDKLRQSILQRDDWRCQFCGAMTNLEVHHLQFRSHSGEDAEANLITLCQCCHATRHGNNRFREGLHTLRRLSGARDG